jgi:hypothetical protein
MMRGAHLFVQSIDMQVGLELVVATGKNCATFSQCNMAWGGFHGLGVQDVRMSKV